ncbi:MAG: hydrogenase formation protein HypD [Bacteroidales bacterium]|nr:hydrogenase formation protein HypD [Bacteroidales bacterium]MCF8349635.1 hydrogenase formation protein HypD [Bacteroidales bacterium]MCF8376076.1 hydrogenase formation protein HypD [Bacteroidales bacterium]MCF8400391.1 hydrogenase formation protein HypD [Bacteroidales bacterium]
MIKFIDEYRDREIVGEFVERIRNISKKPVNLMEVCGGHTMAIQKFGIPSLLPAHINLLSGPGCPVCVSSRQFIDHAVALSRLNDTVIVTFGDLIRVPGSSSNLDKEKASGADVRIVYSILDALQIAQQNPDKKIIFLGIGFETTAPGTAIGMQQAKQKKLNNFFLLSSHKIMPPAMKALIDEGVNISGYIAPGHVSTITGSKIYEELSEKYKVGCVISGFEPVDLLKAIYMLVRQFEEERPAVEIAYKRAVNREGNIKAQKALEEVFILKEDWWRGLGVLPESGLQLNEKYRALDAGNFQVEIEPTREDKGCICGEILKGLNTPKDCKLFGTACTPQDPVGACMVSHEGACAAWYRYNR